MKLGMYGGLLIYLFSFHVLAMHKNHVKTYKIKNFICHIKNSHNKDSLLKRWLNSDAHFDIAKRYKNYQQKYWFDWDALTEKQIYTLRIIKRIKYYSSNRNAEMKTDRTLSEYYTFAPRLKERLRDASLADCYCDFGCGEGDALIGAKKQFGLRGVGIDQQKYTNWERHKDIFFYMNL